MKPGYIRTTCQRCGAVFNAQACTLHATQAALCEMCKSEVILLMEKYSPCCREAYCRGRIASAKDANDKDALRELGKMLDEMRDN